MKEFFFNEFATLRNAILVKINSFTSLFRTIWSKISEHVLIGTSSSSCFITLELFCIQYPLISIIVLNNLHNWPTWKNDLCYNIVRTPFPFCWRGWNEPPTKFSTFFQGGGGGEGGCNFHIINKYLMTKKSL